MPSMKQAALEVSTGSASPVRPWAERKWKAGDGVRRSDYRIVAFDRSVTRHRNLEEESTYLSQRAFASEP
jgi:hypothetical protein